MTAPVFIWIDPGAQEVVQGKVEPDYDRQYVRNDPEALVQSANVQALIAAAVEGAARKVLGNTAPNGMHFYRTPEGYAEAIRALTPADAKAALDRMLQEAKNAKLREVQDEVQKLRREAGGNADGVRFQALDDVRHLLRGLIQEPKP